MNKTMTKLTELEKKVVDTKAAAYSYDTAFFHLRMIWLWLRLGLRL